MFEIGRSLREAREHAGLELADVEAATLIPVRYLEALEHERFDLLPPGFYRRGFLREYAEFLGLDGDLYAAELERRFEPPAPPPPPPPARRRLLDAVSPAALALAAVVVALVAVAVWQLGGSGGNTKTTQAVPPSTSRAPTPAPTTVTTTQRRRPAMLTLTAVRGSCWLSVRTGGASTGRVVYEQTLQQGQHVRFALRNALWIRVGAPWNLDASIDGRTVTQSLPASTGDVVAGEGGLQAAP